MRKRKPYFYVTLDTKNVIEEFIPMIPPEEIRLFDENSTIERICLAPSIEQCLSAVPWGGIVLEEQLDEHEDDKFYVDIRVYEFDLSGIDKKNIIYPSYLYRRDWVRDAFMTKETWVINQNLVPTQSYIIRLKRFDEECIDELSYKDTQLLKKNPDMDYEEVWGGRIYTNIVNLQYEMIFD